MLDTTHNLTPGWTYGDQLVEILSSQFPLPTPHNIPPPPSPIHPPFWHPPWGPPMKRVDFHFRAEKSSPQNPLPTLQSPERYVIYGRSLRIQIFIFRNFPTLIGDFWKTWTSKQSNASFKFLELKLKFCFLRAPNFIKIPLMFPAFFLAWYWITHWKPPQQSSPSSLYAYLVCIVDWQITSIIFIFNRFFLLLNLFWGYRRWMELIVCLQIIMNANIFISNAQLSHLNGTCFGFKIQYSES